jgi:photosystem II stability/assembly factor-like uncharacterized protein
MLRQSLTLFVLCALAPAISNAQELSRIHQPTLTPQNSGTTNGLIAVSPVNPQVVWASGRAGTFTVTTDGGRTWRAGVVPGAEALQFRDVQGVSAKVAYLMSIGTSGDPGDFRIYKTEDGGANWTLQFQNQNPGAFYDCFAFWTPRRGIAHSDSVNGVFPDLRTTDGTTWEDISDAMPPALTGEFSFASSGTCVATQGGRKAWIVTGGASVARVLATRDGPASSHGDGAVVITANDGGAAWTPDEGDTWFPLTGVSGFWAVAFASPKAGWLVGTDGRILKISF